LARALHGTPRIVVLDEPELGLDGASLRQLMRVLDSLRREGVSLVIATQDPRLLQLTDKVVVLSGGAVQSIGPSADLARRMQQGNAPAAGGSATSAPGKTTAPRPAAPSPRAVAGERTGLH
jgi:ABC-type protease/lipase transport system fused ATPase/permease subunit